MRTCSVALGLAIVFCVGCGSNAPFQYVPVEGVVSYEDGSQLPAGGFQLKFISLEAPEVPGAKPRPAIAHVNEVGRFEQATSYKFGDGLIPGKHRVAFIGASSKEGKPLLPKAYSSTRKTPLIIDTADSPLEIKVPKP